MGRRYNIYSKTSPAWIPPGVMTSAVNVKRFVVLCSSDQLLPIDI